MNAVGARLGDHRDDRLSLAVLGREGVPQQVDFLHGVDRRVERHVVPAQRPHVDAVDGVVRRAVAAALDGDVLVAPAVEQVLPLEVTRRDAGRRAP